MTTNRIPPSAQTPDQLLAQINQLMSEAEALLVGPTAPQVTSQSDEFKAAFVAMHRRVTALYGHARRKMGTSARAADQLIRAHPYESLAIAVGAGVLLGAWIQRER